MEKLTLSIRDKEKIAWVKAYTKKHDTSISRMFENYVDMLISFDRRKFKISKTLQSLRQPGKRPTVTEIEMHLARRRKRSSIKK